MANLPARKRNRKVDPLERNPEVLKVVSAIILHPQMNKILLAKRFYRITLGGFWELPSSPIRNGETPEQAVCREVKETLGVVALGAVQIHEQLHPFLLRDVLVTTFVITDTYGEVDLAKPIKHAKLEWFKHPQNIKPLAMSAAVLLPNWQEIIQPFFYARRKGIVKCSSA